MTTTEARQQKLAAAFPGRSWWNTWTSGRKKEDAEKFLSHEEIAASTLGADGWYRTPESDLDALSFLDEDEGIFDDQKRCLEEARAKDGNTEHVRRVEAMFAALEQYRAILAGREPKFDYDAQYRAYVQEHKKRRLGPHNSNEAVCFGDTHNRDGQITSFGRLVSHPDARVEKNGDIITAVYVTGCRKCQETKSKCLCGTTPDLVERQAYNRDRGVAFVGILNIVLEEEQRAKQRADEAEKRRLLEK